IARKAKKSELAYLWGVQASHFLAFGLPPISLSSDTQRRMPSYRGRYHIRLIHSSASIVDQIRRRSSTAAAIGRLGGISSSPALWRAVINSAKCRGMVGRRWRANGGQVPRYASRNPVVTASQPVSPGQSTGLAARSRTNRTAESVARLAARL